MFIKVLNQPCAEKIKITPGFNRGNSANKQKKGASGDIFKSTELTMRRNWKLY